MSLSGKPSHSARPTFEPRPTASHKANATLPQAYRPIGLARPQHPIVELPMQTATAWSVGLHVVAPFVLALVTFLLLLLVSWLLDMNWTDWFKPPEKKQDLVFTLVDDTRAKQPEQARFKGEFNQEAGGKTDADKPVEPDDKPMQTTASPPAEPPTPQQKPVPPQAQPTPKPVVQNIEKKPASKPLIAVPAQPAQKSAPQQAAKTAPPTPKALVASAGTPSPVPSFGKDGAFGNPEGGKNPNAGVNVVADADFGPFMSDLQKRIKRNWTPPRGTESQQVKLLFEVSRDGRLMKVEVAESSGNNIADEAAVRAVQASAPFRPFPPEVRDEVLPIEFTFDYNVFNPSKRAF